MSKILQSFSILSVVFLASSCQDPYPKEGKIQLEKPVEPAPVLPPIFLRTPQTIFFSEGVANSVKFEATVPSPGVAIMEVADLPAGAKFDAASSLLSWAPNWTQGNDPKDPQAQVMTYVIRVRVASTTDPKLFLQKEVTLVVANVNRGMTIRGATSARIKEGIAWSQTFMVDAPDAPNGPFQFDGVGLPKGAVITSRGSNQFQLDFTPGFEVVRSTDAGERRFTFELVGRGPLGLMATQRFDLDVTDVRKKPNLTGSRAASGGTTVQFPLVAEDLNREAPPTLKLKTAVPFGASAITPVSTTTDTAAVQFEWTGIPIDQLGTTKVLTFEACTNNRECVTSDVTVSLIATTLPQISMDRNAWPLGEVKYLRSGSSMNVSLPISETSGGLGLKSITIEPASLASQISWKNGVITLTPQTVGLKQFNVVAASKAGVTQLESFMLEVLPSDWSNTLFVSSAQTDPVNQLTAQLLARAQGASVATINATSQDLDARTLALRELAVVGSGVLTDSRISARVSDAISSIKRIVIQSPIFDQIGGTLGGELRNLGVSLDRRYTPGSSGTPLDKLPISAHPNMSLPSPASPMILAGQLTSDAAQPAVLQNLGNSCRTAFEGISAPNRFGMSLTQVTFGLSCRRWGGGQLLITGFDFADLAPQSGDLQIPARWIREWR